MAATCQLAFSNLEQNRSRRPVVSTRWLTDWWRRRCVFLFRDHWLLPGTVTEVADILSQPDQLPQWWPQFLSASTIHRGVDGQVGSSYFTRFKGFMPYLLRFDFDVRTVDYPNHFVVGIYGDLRGRGSGHLRQEGDHVRIDYIFELELKRLALQMFSFVGRPLMRSHHVWAMRQGEKGIRAWMVARKDTIPPGID